MRLKVTCLISILGGLLLSLTFSSLGYAIFAFSFQKVNKF